MPLSDRIKSTALSRMFRQIQEKQAKTNEEKEKAIEPVLNSLKTAGASDAEIEVLREELRI